MYLDKFFDNFFQKKNYVDILSHFQKSKIFKMKMQEYKSQSRLIFKIPSMKNYTSNSLSLCVIEGFINIRIANPVSLVNLISNIKSSRNRKLSSFNKFTWVFYSMTALISSGWSCHKILTQLRFKNEFLFKTKTYRL